MPIPCVVRDPPTDILAEDDSLSENIQRAPLHPLDQFLAFQALRDKGRSEEDIASSFFTSVNVVKQRLRLRSVSLTPAGARSSRSWLPSTVWTSTSGKRR